MHGRKTTGEHNVDRVKSEGFCKLGVGNNREGRRRIDEGKAGGVEGGE